MSESRPSWRFEVLHFKIRAGDKEASQLCELTSALDVGKIVLQQREPRTVVVGVDSLGAILERVTRLVADQHLVDADETAVVVCVESVDDLHHIGVGNVAERPVHVVVQESGATERQIEAAVPRLAVERCEIVAVAIELVCDKGGQRIEQCFLGVYDLQLDRPGRVFIEGCDQRLSIPVLTTFDVEDDRLAELMSEASYSNSGSSSSPEVLISNAIGSRCPIPKQSLGSRIKLSQAY